MKVLVTGKNGQLGQSIKRLLDEKCFASLSSLFAFWFYNKPPAKIFMGDSGSLVIGVIIAYSAIKLCSFPVDTSGNINPVFILCVIAYPSVDTLRVFLVRIFAGKSPFAADRNHIHHLLVDKNFNHGWARFFILKNNNFPKKTQTIYNLN